MGFFLEAIKLKTSAVNTFNSGAPCGAKH